MLNRRCRPRRCWSWGAQVRRRRWRPRRPQSRRPHSSTCCHGQIAQTDSVRTPQAVQPPLEYGYLCPRAWDQSLRTAETTERRRHLTHPTRVRPALAPKAALTTRTGPRAARRLRSQAVPVPVWALSHQESFTGSPAAVGRHMKQAMVESAPPVRSPPLPLGPPPADLATREYDFGFDVCSLPSSTFAPSVPPSHLWDSTSSQSSAILNLRSSAVEQCVHLAHQAGVKFNRLHVASVCCQVCTCGCEPPGGTAEPKSRGNVDCLPGDAQDASDDEADRGLQVDGEGAG